MHTAKPNTNNSQIETIKYFNKNSTNIYNWCKKCMENKSNVIYSHSNYSQSKSKDSQNRNNYGNYIMIKYNNKIIKFIV